MYEITLVENFGRIYQVTKLKSIRNKENLQIIQTFGRPLEKSYKCTEQYKLYKILTRDIHSDVLIQTISSFEINDEMIRLFKICNCKGYNIYLHTFETYKLFFVDKMIY